LKRTGAAGNRGPDIRSDCYFEIELTDSGGIQMDIRSKVDRLFGTENRQLIRDMLDFFDIPNAKVILEDSGALSFVMMARIEAAVKKVTDTNKEYLPELIPENRYSTKRDRYRRSRLYLPGNTPKLFINAGLYQSDGIILDSGRFSSAR